MSFFKQIALVSTILLAGATAFAQNNIKAVLLDASTGDPVGFATASLTRTGQTKPTKYVLSSEKGIVNIESVRNGDYVFKAELLGYKPVEKTIKMEGKTIDLGEVKMDLDTEILDAASVSAVGNPIIIKKDTIEYNASSFKTTENDMLEDLLKKLPGVEIDDDGAITVNGESITKITIDGKTFFLDDPQVASKNLPAKLINKLKVIKKKSEQAEFTGIDDGQEENVIDLSVKPGMMQGVVGNLQAGGGHDIPSENNTMNDFRFAGNGFLGKFTSKANISLILNANNTNNQAATDRSGNMMRGMMGGGGMGGGMMMGGGGMGGGMMGGGGMAGGFGGGGINTSYMAGLNAAFDLLDGRMELGGNYMFNHNDRISSSEQFQETKYDDHSTLSYSDSKNSNKSMGHNFGIRLEHEFSKNTSIIFQPQFNFGTGSFTQQQTSSMDYAPNNGTAYKLNDSEVNNGGENKNYSASGMFIFRQRLGIPGRTLTAQVRYSLSNNEIDGFNQNTTTTYNPAGDVLNVQDINQTYTQTQKSYQLSGRATYTEPMGDFFYLEANYSYSWNKSVSDKQTYDMNNGGLLDLAYTNNVVNETMRHDFGGNVLFQKPDFRAQIGFSAIPTHTINTTTNGLTPVDPIDDKRWNFSPQARIDADLSENTNLRIFYRGQSSQPSTSQLMPVPDISNPLSISFGNPHLTPYFNHNANIELRTGNRQKFTSFTVRLNGGMVQNPISSVSWQGSNGARYSMPFNGKNSGNAGINTFFNLPIAKSNFSVNNQLSGNWSTSSSYLANKVDMSKYPNPMTDYYKFMDEFYNDHQDLDNSKDFTPYNTHNISVNERIRLTYRSDAVEVTLGANTRMSQTLYTIESMQTRIQWTNRVEGSFTWTWDGPGITLSTDGNYRWYNGNTTEQRPVFTLNAELTKLLFKKQATLSLRGYDLLGQQNNFNVSDRENLHTETLSNTLGRYIILSFTWRFGSFGGRNGRRGPGGPGMGGPGGPGMRGGMPMGGPPMGGGRPPMM